MKITRRSWTHLLCICFVCVWAAKPKDPQFEPHDHDNAITWSVIQGLGSPLYTIQIMNVYECNGTNIFMRWKMKCSIQRGEAELNGTFHLSPNENICSIARMKKHSLFVLYNTKIDPCHLTSGTHCTLSFSLLLQFHRYPIFKQSRVQPSQKFSNSESNKVCLRFTKCVQGKIFAFSDISCLDELQMQYTVIYDCRIWQSWQNSAPLTVWFEAWFCF